jgi:hypothetical protein
MLPGGGGRRALVRGRAFVTRRNAQLSPATRAFMALAERRVNAVSAQA